MRTAVTARVSRVTARVWYSTAQPYLFPPLYIVERLARVHHWVVLEEAQFDRRHVQVRLTGAQHDFLVSPLLVAAGRQPFSEITLVDSPLFVAKLERTAQLTYGRCLPYQALQPRWHGLLQELRRQTTLVGQCRLTLTWLRRVLGLPFIIHDSRALVPERPRSPAAWVMAFARPLGASDYLQGRAGIVGYLGNSDHARGVQLWAQTYAPPGAGVRADLSVLDTLFRHGPEATRAAIFAQHGPGNVAGTAESIVSW